MNLRLTSITLGLWCALCLGLESMAGAAQLQQSLSCKSPSKDVKNQEVKRCNVNFTIAQIQLWRSKGRCIKGNIENAAATFGFSGSSVWVRSNCHAYVNVKGKTIVPTPKPVVGSSSPTPKPVTAPPAQNPDDRFDVNGDGAVDDQDAKDIQCRYYAFFYAPYQPPPARNNYVPLCNASTENDKKLAPFYDATGDGKFTLEDLTLVVGQVRKQYLDPTGAECGPEALVYKGRCWYAAQAPGSCKQVCDKHGGFDKATVYMTGWIPWEERETFSPEEFDMSRQQAVFQCEELGSLFCQKWGQPFLKCPQYLQSVSWYNIGNCPDAWGCTISNMPNARPGSPLSTGVCHGPRQTSAESIVPKPSRPSDSAWRVCACNE